MYCKELDRTVSTESESPWLKYYTIDNNLLCKAINLTNCTELKISSKIAQNEIENDYFARNIAK